MVGAATGSRTAPKGGSVPEPPLCILLGGLGLGSVVGLGLACGLVLRLGLVSGLYNLPQRHMLVILSCKL